jgi:hypothetical protein
VTVRTDVTIDWTASPRIITIAAPSTAITIQDLSDTLRFLEWRIDASNRPYILDNEGKFDLGTKLTGISLRLVNAKLAFEARGGPSWAECTVTGGNLAAVDDVGSAVWPIEFTNYTSVTFESDVSAALISGTGGALTPSQEAELTQAATEAKKARQAAVNKAIIAVTDDEVTIYEDDGLTPLFEFDISSDKRQRIPK